MIAKSLTQAFRLNPMSLRPAMGFASYESLQRREFKKFKKAAIVLSGCGVYDGSEINEAISIMISLSQHNVAYQCFAPNKDQFHTINHLKGEEILQKRNVMQEAARIARGNVKELSTITAGDFDAIFCPGGFGAAKNLSDFATQGERMTIDPQLEHALKQYHLARRVIGACCIFPVILARLFGKSTGGSGVRLTLGSKGKEWPYGDSIEAVSYTHLTLPTIYSV
eukprot:TRINITY_DN11324_c0_g1_i3.p1 TRINITY_DN11324_c0_g1~~TRINITY_DN11324_c0_g1_i3.p1  ORF type:complete len:224 (-),score=52.89 TRINITY_DN11324_c0_g1_i3:35-706(-)